MCIRDSNIHPYLLAFPIAIGASYAFMMPTGTPPNALVFASGHVRVTQMWRAGIVLNILSIAVITLIVYYLGPCCWVSTPGRSQQPGPDHPLYLIAVSRDMMSSSTGLIFSDTPGIAVTLSKSG